MNQLPEAAREIARQATDVARETARRVTVAANDVTGAVNDAAKDVTDAAKDGYKTLSSKVEEGVERTKEYAQHAVDATQDAARDMYQSAALKAEDTLAASKEYVRQNPVLVVVGALAFGAAIGCMLMMARRQPTTRQRYVDEPLDSAHKAIIAALAPVAQRLREGYDSARDGAGNAMDRVHRFNPGRTVDSLSGQIGRVGSNLKFW
jgi:ElaB/YqjD/DUF883 family membrane-anchored ribosome-binding protein